MAISTSDFDKIWASSSPLTPYSFSDSNYEEGWNFVGSTPPARQMWDGYMKWSDEKQQYIVQNFLPLSGGTMTGDITLADGGKALSDAIVGTRKTDTESETVIVPSVTVTNVASVSIEAGTWVVTGHIKFDSVTADKLYACALSESNTSANLANDGTTSIHSSNSSFVGLQVVRIFVVNTTTTVYLNVYATANCTVTNAQIEAVQIK